MRYSLIMLPFVLVKRTWAWFVDKVAMPMKTYGLSLVWRMKCGRHVRFMGRTIIRAYQQDAITIGDNTVFNSCLTRNLVGLLGPTILCACDGGKITVGHDSGFSSVVINARTGVSIGNYVNIGGNVRIFDHDFHPLDWQDRRPPQKIEKVRAKPVIIEDDVFIGTNAIILKGTHIGARSIIAAGAVVVGLDVPPDSMVKGNPAVIVGNRK